MVAKKLFWTGTAIYGVVAVGSMTNARATPQFARETGMSCNNCHRHIPLLNEFGQKFYANGFRLSSSGKDKEEMNKTIPAWAILGAQGTISRSLGSTIPISWASTEIASYGFFDSVKLLYHFEYQPTENQTNIYVLHPFAKNLTAQVGEVGLLGQYDPRLDVFNSRSINLSPPGTGPLGNGRVGPFSPGSNAYGVRLNYALTGESAMPYTDGWKLAATVPFSDEAPCGTQPVYNSDPTGVFVEGYRRTGLSSYGVDMFDGRDGRRYYGALAQQKVGKSLFFEGGVSYAVFDEGNHTGLASLATTWTPGWDKALGLRIDDQDGIFSLVPTASWWIGGKTSAFHMAAEATITHGVAPTTMVYAQLKF